MHEAITLGPTGNLQGSVKFYSLDTGRVLKRRLFTPIPMPDRIIAKIKTFEQKKSRVELSASSTDRRSRMNGRMKFLRTMQNFRGF
jgi:hypothetical protein